MVNDGHIIGNHTVNHKSMPSINNETIEKRNYAITSINV